MIKRLCEIQKQLKAPKNQRNTFGNYNYRSCEDILEAVKPLLIDEVVTIKDEIVFIGNRYYVKATSRIENGDGKFLEVTAYAREAEIKKGMDEAQITGSASSYARKYSLNGLFLIDDTKDADTQDNRPQATVATKKPYTKPVYQKPVSAPKQAVAKPQITEEEFKTAIKKMLEVSMITPESKATDVMKFLTVKYTISKEYEDKIEDEIYTQVFGVKV